MSSVLRIKPAVACCNSLTYFSDFFINSRLNESKLAEDNENLPWSEDFLSLPAVETELPVPKPELIPKMAAAVVVVIDGDVVGVIVDMFVVTLTSPSVLIFAR